MIQVWFVRDNILQNGLELKQRKRKIEKKSWMNKDAKNVKTISARSLENLLQQHNHLPKWQLTREVLRTF